MKTLCRKTPLLWTLLLAASVHAQAMDCTGVTPVSGEAITLELVSNLLSNPLDAVAPPGDLERLFVVEKRGRIRIIDLQTDNLAASAFLDIQVRVQDDGDRGLLSVAFHPDYATNGEFFVHYNGTQGSGDTFISRFRVSESSPNLGDPDSEEILLSYDQPRSNHNGGKIAFGPLDGYLYITSGDGGKQHDPDGNAQDPFSFLGKILRIDVDAGAPYGIPPSNPYLGGVEALEEIWARGMRSPWRFAFDRMNGDLYIGDVGQNVWEEIDYQPGTSSGGENYEWNLREGDNPHDGSLVDLGPRVPPIFDYDHGGTVFRSGRSVTGGEVYRGCRMPDLRGRYFFADYTDDWVASFRVDEGGNRDEPLEHTAELNAGIAPAALDRVAAFGVDGRGEIYILGLPNTVYRIVPSSIEGQPPTASLVTDPSPPVVELSDGLAEITLDAAASGDGDGGLQALTFSWEKLSGPQGDSILAPGGEITTVSFTAPGAYTYRLRVEDADGSDEVEVTITVLPEVGRFLRGDANADEVLDIADPIFSLAHLFQANAAPVACEDSADSNDDGEVDLSDAVYSLSAMFLGTVGHLPPLLCGSDPTNTDALGCETDTCE